jgi:uncharacterized protein YndB with AHSA1/START domain
MPIIEVTPDPATLTLTIVGEYPVGVERLWEAWSDPRQLERFWGPPTWPATFTRHDMVEGGRSEYFMTGPDGSRSDGFWRIEKVDPGRSLSVADGFADEDGNENTDLPGTRTHFTFEPTAGGSRFTAVTTFADLEAMQQLIDMGMVEGATLAISQLDDLLADLAAFARGRSVDTDLLSDTKVRVSRVIRGTADQVWRAHHDPALMQRWLLGPDGWTMPVCQVARIVGERYRYEWESADGASRFGFEGELLESISPNRSVTTEQMIDTGGPYTINEMTLTPVTGGTLLSIVITYPTRELRDEILATGMTDGMEVSYQRLESLIPAATA